MMASLQSTTRVELVWLHLCMSYLVKVLCSWGSDGFVIISGSLWSNGLCRFASTAIFLEKIRISSWFFLKLLLWIIEEPSCLKNPFML
uniref:Uncharacterized protein n=1 Tax=Brassica campestris TaxID=3711 RepID=A0A3P6A558_BRACM|nr:unnamed protein product [Brassica rapa]